MATMRSSRLFVCTALLVLFQLPSQADNNLIPAVCYDVCNNAHLVTQAFGKSPELCASDSGFLSYYHACQDCIGSHSNGTSADSTYLDSEFDQYVAYCQALPADTGPASSSASMTRSSSSSEKTLSGEVTILTAFPYTGTLEDGMVTVWTLSKTITSFAPLPSTTVITITTTENSHSTLWIFTKTLNPLPTSLIDRNATDAAITTITPGPTPGSNSDAGTDSLITNPNHQVTPAWIAGPIIGGIAGVTILVTAGWLLMRRRTQAAKRKQARNELHGESVLKSEMPVEPKPQELPAKEPIGHENNPSELPAESA